MLPEKRVPGMPSTEVTSGTVYEEDGSKLEAVVRAINQITEKSRYMFRNLDKDQLKKITNLLCLIYFYDFQNS